MPAGSNLQEWISHELGSAVAVGQSDSGERDQTVNDGQLARHCHQRVNLGDFLLECLEGAFGCGGECLFVLFSLFDAERECGVQATAYMRMISGV